MRSIPVAIALAILTICSSCYTYHCDDPEPNVRLVGFDSVDLKKVVVRSYAKNSGFSNPLNTVDADMSQYGPYNSFDIDFSHDWAFEIPAVQKAYKISDIDIDKVKGDTRHVFSGEVTPCSHGLSYTLNGSAISNKGEDAPAGATSSGAIRHVGQIVLNK